MTYDSILKQVGEFGPYHIRIFFILNFIIAFEAFQSCSIIFHNAEYDFRCAIPNYDNDTFTIQSESHRSLVNISVGFEKDTHQFSRCSIYAPQVVGKGLNISSRTSSSNRSVEQCQRWVYDPEEAKRSIVAELDLVCDRKVFKSHSSMCFLLGTLVASLVGGPIADLVGRKKVLVVSAVLSGVSGINLTFIDSIPLMLLFRFLSACFGTFMYFAAFVLMAELVSPRKRTFATLGIVFGWSLGMLFMDFVYYVIPNWRVVQIGLAMPGFLAMACWWLLPESPRWLLVQNRVAEAKSIIVKMAEVNKVKLPDDIEVHLRDESVLLEKDISESGKSKRKIWHLFTSRIMAIRIINLSFGWCAVSMVYYGLTFSVGDLVEGSIFVNFAVQALMELAVNIILILTLEKVGRKKIYCFFILISGLACLANVGPLVAGVKLRWVDIMLYSIGKLGITAAFSVIYILTAELIPTELRNSGLGLCSCIGRIGGVVSPYIGNLKNNIPTAFGQTLPLLIFGSCSIIAGLTALTLPETRNRKLPDTMAEAEAQGKSSADFTREDAKIATCI